ncbi:uncharacterized protein LOC116286655 [Actinia tenebrosa]|uniref:Uncharacterized protein LOC116286655 n=1 Tax=Actinia tenebrosa TaxID=6105 RepID=A0A6P8H9D5_ACTTE|nr:uncharacterized protein LOC116286655 [Actinia tenebrosa]
MHPVYDRYAGSEDGEIFNIIRMNTMKELIGNNEYLRVAVRKNGETVQKLYYSHRFIWECYNELIEDGKVIDHINSDKQDNRLRNLQLVTQQQNCMKSAKGRDYSFVKNNHRNKKYVKAIDIDDDNKESFYGSMYAVQQPVRNFEAEQSENQA